MDLSAPKIRGLRSLLALLALTAGAGALHATNLMTATVSGPITCSMQTGPGAAATITIKASPALTGSNTMLVTFNAPANGLVLTQAVSGSAGNTLTASNSTTGVVFDVSAAAGCVGNGNNTTTIQFNRTVSGTLTADITANVVDTVTSSTKLIAVVSGPVTCSTVIGPGAPATITITPFTALTGSNTIAVTFNANSGGLVVTPAAGTTLSATITSLVYNVNTSPGCAGNGNNTTSIQFNEAGTADAVASVVDTVTTATLLTAVVSGPVTCSVATGPGTAATVTITAATALTGSSTIAVTFAAVGNGLVLTPQAGTTLNSSNSTTGIIYNVNVSSSTCNGAGNNTTVIQFKANGASDVTARVVDTVTSPYVLSATVSGPISCSTLNGPGAAATITIAPFTPLTGSNTIVVTNVAAGNGLILTPPAGGTTLNTSTALTLVYTVNAAPNCVGNSSIATVIQFKAAGVTDVTASVSDTVTVNGTALVVNPSSIAITCTLSTGTYTPGRSQTASITSSANGGTPFTVDTTVNPPASWITLNPLTLTATATTTPTTFAIVATPTVGPTPGCGGFLAGSIHTTTIHLVNGAAPDKLISVSLQIVATSPLTVTPVPAAPSVSLSYVKGSGNVATANVLVSSSVPSVFILLDTTTLPIWLTVDNTSGTAPWSLRFSTTTYTNSLAPGTYTTTVYLEVSGYADTPVPITLQVNNKAPTLSVNATSVSLSWTIGTPYPTATITATSSDSPIQYAITTGGTLAPVVSAAEQAGLAYSFGTGIGVTFSPLAFASAQPGSVLTGTVTLTWGSPASTTVVTFLVTVSSPGATLSGLSPQTLPTAAPLTPFSISLTGTGFVSGTNAASATRVGIVVNGQIVTDTAFTITVVNPSNIILNIVVPNTADTNLPFSPSGLGGIVQIGVVNGNANNIPTGQLPLYIGVGPIVQGVTSASSFIEVTPPTLPTMAPYDMISIWGANFCSSNGTGCASNTILPGAPNAATLIYPTSLPLPAPDATGRLVSVTFQDTSGNFIGNAPLLFATNTQINAIVPAAVSTFAPGTVDIVVNFGFGTAPVSTLLQSAPFPVNIAATDPGMFTVGSDGQGSGAALSAGYSLITATSPAGMRAGTTVDSSLVNDSDTILLYGTGLGVPLSAGDNTQTSQGCIAAVSGTGNYMATLQAATQVSPALSNIDGAVIQSALLNTGNMAPCLTVLPTVTIGGVPAGTVSYAGWVADTVAGLYQINVQLPATGAGPFYPNWPLTSNPIASLTTAVQLPVQVTVGGVTSQAGVTLWITPRLRVTDPAGNITGSPLDVIATTVGVSYNGTVTASETVTGTAYTYKVTSGLMPAGLTLNTATGVISGRPAANTSGSYTITVTATDNAVPVPLTGTVTFTIQVNGGLYLTTSGTPPYTAVFGTPIAGTPTVTASGGAYPYTYSLAFSDNLGNPAVGTPAGMAISNSGVITTTALTMAGTYHVTATALDHDGVTGSITFDVVIALNVTEAVGSGADLYVITATGYSGTPTYALSGPGAAAGLTMTANNVTVGTASGGPYSTTATVTDTETLAPGAADEGVGSVTWSATP